MKALMMRGERIAREAQRRACERVAAHVLRRLPFANIVTEQGKVEMSGRGLARKWLIDPALRFVAEHVR